MKNNKLTIIGIALCAILFVACSSPESDGKKLAEQSCDCQKKYAEMQEKIYLDFIARFDSYGFKTRTEARQKWQEIKDDAAKQLEQCKEAVEQKVKETKSKYPTGIDDLRDPEFLKKYMQNPQKYANEFTKNQEKSKAFNEAFRNAMNQCSVPETNMDYSAIDAKVLTIIPQKPDLAKLKQDLVRRRIIEQANGYYGRNWYWQINSVDELKSVKIEKEEKVGSDYVLDVHLLLQKDANQHEANLKITCILQQHDDWTIDFIETKNIQIVKTGRYNNCIAAEIKKGYWGTSLEFTNNCDVKLIIGGEILNNNDEWTKFSSTVNATGTSSVTFNGKEYRIDFVERQ